MPGRNTTYHEQKTSAKTRVSYAYDLQVFFRFLLEKNPALSDKKMKEITLNDIDHLASNDIEEYQEYLKYYEADNGEQRNGATSIARKMSSLRSFLDYFYKKEMLAKNVAMQVDMPKLHEKAIIRLEPDEVAIITLFLGTGIRVSECVGLDVTDLNFRNKLISGNRGYLSGGGRPGSC